MGRLFTSTLGLRFAVLAASSVFLTSCLNGGGNECEKPFDKVVSPDSIKNSNHIFIAIEKLDFLDGGNFVIAQTVHSAAGRICVDSKRTSNPHRRRECQQHALSLWNSRFLAQQPFCEHSEPKYARHSGCNFLRREITAQHLSDFLEHLAHCK